MRRVHVILGILQNPPWDIGNISTSLPEISEGFDSLSGLLSDLRSAQDDAQQEVSRALKERDKLLSCLQNKDENDDRMQGERHGLWAGR